MLIRLLLCAFVVVQTHAGLNAQPPVTAVRFDSAAQSLVACSQSGVTVYDWPSLRQRSLIRCASPNLHDLAFSPSGDRLAVAGGTPTEEGTVALYSWPAGELLRTLAAHQDSVMSVQWLDDVTLASASLDSEIKIWKLKSTEPPKTLSEHSRGVTTLGFLQGHKTLVSGGIDQSLRVWAVDTGNLARSMTLHVRPVSSVAVRPTSEGLPMIASASDDSTVRFWQPTIGRMVRFARLPARPCEIRWLPSGSQAAVCCDDGDVYLVDPETVKVSTPILGVSGRAYALAVHPAGKVIVVGGERGSLVRVKIP